MPMPGVPAPVRALSATISGEPSPSLTDASSLQDLFDATNWALSKGTVLDQQTLLAIFSQLNTCRRD